MLVTVCLNGMRTGAAEFERLEGDPAEFVNLALDTCDKQESETVKTRAAKLLEAMCDNVDGSTTMLVHFCANALNFALCEPGTEQAL